MCCLRRWCSDLQFLLRPAAKVCRVLVTGVDGSTFYCYGFCLFGENEWMLLSTLKHAEPFSFGYHCSDR